MRLEEEKKQLEEEKKQHEEEKKQNSNLELRVAQNKPTVMVLGAIGLGKSTILNRLSGAA